MFLKSQQRASDVCKDAPFTFHGQMPGEDKDKKFALRPALAPTCARSVGAWVMGEFARSRDSEGPGQRRMQPARRQPNGLLELLHRRGPGQPPKSMLPGLEVTTSVPHKRSFIMFKN